MTNNVVIHAVTMKRRDAYTLEWTCDICGRHVRYSTRWSGANGEAPVTIIAPGDNSPDVHHSTGGPLKVTDIDLDVKY